MNELRFISYLAPSLPEGLFTGIAGAIGAALGVRASVRFETQTSAPPPGEVDPFTAGEADIGFLCSPGYVRLTESRQPAVRLLRAAPVFLDPRTHGRPVFFSDVIVERDDPAECFDELCGGTRTWAYNDPCSLSGYLSLIRRLRGAPGPLFRTLRQSGSHLESIRLVAAGKVHGAAIDSNALIQAHLRDPELATRIRVVESWGPFPIQPIVASVRLSEVSCARIATALLSLRHDGAHGRHLARFNVDRFAAVSDSDYAGERAALRTCSATLTRSICSPR